ncbi:Bifunctional epoxide hydrolase 2 [Merluccius polli]|uniref:Bifunctional epoxide hydrolase 2 n=1 Tax=Merluccius polli TaxID=89951 RepID=A0AA47NW64_MERPO|nr:Bifunctional epoxide hydrolase 2 [Merluccius polli]
MAQTKAVLFNFWGVVVRPRPAALFRLHEEANALPRGFVSKIASQRDGALTRAERGEITLSQLILELDSELVKDAKVQGLTLPSDWTVRDLLAGIGEMQADPAVLQTAVSLRRHGIRTAVLANHWVDDTATGNGWACLLSVLGANFDHVLQSCRTGLRVPERAMFTSALQRLGVEPQQRRGGARHSEEHNRRRQLIVEHIQSFTCRASHYGRRGAPGRKYLPSDLNVLKMHELFEAQSHAQTSYSLYYSVFSKDFQSWFWSPSYGCLR